MSEQPPRQINALVNQLHSFGIESPSEQLAKEFGEYVYFLRTTQDERMRRYFFPWGIYDEKEHYAICDKIAFSYLDNPIFGVVKKPDYQIIDLQQNPRRHYSEKELEAGAAVLGQMYRRTTKPYSADSISLMHWEENSSKVGPISINILFIADGATMMIAPDQWPTEVREKCSIGEADRPFPDCFWAAGWNALLGNSSVPIPDKFLQNPAIQEAYKKGFAEKIKQYISQNILAQSSEDIAKYILLKMMNPAIGEFLHNAFQDFGEGTFEYYPSGIGAVIVDINPYTRAGSLAINQGLVPHELSGYCTTGDISISEGGGGYGGYNLVNDPYRVDRHDRELDQLLGRDDASTVARIARKRAVYTGNLQGFDPDPQAIQSNSLNTRKTIYAYTDGFRLSSRYLLGRARRDELITQGVDITAQALSRDPRLAILERRLQRKQSPDDASFITLDRYDCRHGSVLRVENSPFEGLNR